MFNICVDKTTYNFSLIRVNLSNTLTQTINSACLVRVLMLVLARA